MQTFNEWFNEFEKELRETNAHLGDYVLNQYIYSMRQYMFKAWIASENRPGYRLVPKELSRYDAEVEAENAWDLHVKHFKYEYKDMTGLQLAEFKYRWIEKRAIKNQKEYSKFLGIITNSSKEV